MENNAVDGGNAMGNQPTNNMMNGPAGQPVNNPGMGINSGNVGLGMGPNGMNGGANMMNPGPMPKKPPMDPAKKKKIILGVVLGVVGLIVVVVVIIVIMMLLKVDYGETYRLTKELEEKVDDIVYDYPCENVVSAVDNAYTSVEDYTGDVNECKATMDGVDDLVARLGETAGVKRNADLKGRFESLRTELDKVVPNADDLAGKLDLYSLWHKWVVLEDEIDTKSTDAEIQTAANVLIESGNEILKKYGEGWLEKRLAYNQAYRAHFDAPWTDMATYNATRDVLNNAKVAFNDYVATSEPDIKALAELNFEDVTGLEKAFTNFNNQVIELYEQNYDYESGDCSELFGEVVCE